MNKKNRKKGFTLVELIVVIAILAILATIAVPTTIAVLDKGKDQAANTELSESVNALVNRVATDGLTDMFTSNEKLVAGFPDLVVKVEAANSIAKFDVIYDIVAVQEEATSGSASAQEKTTIGYTYTVYIQGTSVRDSKGMHKAVKPIKKKVAEFETAEVTGTKLEELFPNFTATKDQTFTFKNSGAAEQSGVITDTAKLAEPTWTNKQAAPTSL